MSTSLALQIMVRARLLAVPAIVDLIGARVYDKPPADAVAPYISFGPSDIVPEDDDCISARTETLQIDLWSVAQDGKREVKTLADLVKTALHRFDGTIDPGALVELDVVQMRILDDPDGITLHGVVVLRAVIEEPGA